MFSVLHFWHFPPPNVMSLFRKPKKSFLCRVKEFNLDLSQNFSSFWLRYISETHFRLCQREHLKMGYFEHNLKVRWKDESLFWVYSAVRVFPFMPKTKKKIENLFWNLENNIELQIEDSLSDLWYSITFRRFELVNTVKKVLMVFHGFRTQIIFFS